MTSDRLIQTDLGYFPEDWLPRTVGDYGPFVTSGSRGWASFYSESGSAFIRITNLSRKWLYLDLSDLRFVRIPFNSSEGARTQLRSGDMLVSITADIGIVGYITESIPKPAYINQHIALVRFDGSSINSRYTSYFLSSEITQRTFRALTDAGAKAGMNLATVRQLKLMVPPTLAEQEAIANALSDADAYIESLEKLIEKKRAIKKGAMQELLTGKRRLPGFSGEWKNVLLGNYADFFKGKGLPKSEISLAGAKKCIHYGELFTTYQRIINEPISRTDATGDFVLSSSNDVLMPTSDVTPRGLATASSILASGVILGGDILVIRPSAGLFGPYLSYCIKHSAEQILQLVTGTTVFHIYANDMKRFQFLLPGLEEQIAIIDFLEANQNLIDSLERKLFKARLLKQGMMQELLTGRIRLV